MCYRSLKWFTRHVFNVTIAIAILSVNFTSVTNAFDSDVSSFIFDIKKLQGRPLYPNLREVNWTFLVSFEIKNLLDKHEILNIWNCV